MSDDGPRGRVGPDERAWMEVVDRTVRSDDDCCDVADGLRASRLEFHEDANAAGVSRAQMTMIALIVLSIPVILYSDLITPNGATNYAGMGTGLVLMIAAALAHR